MKEMFKKREVYEAPRMHEFGVWLEQSVLLQGSTDQQKPVGSVTSTDMADDNTVSDDMGIDYP
ncbi:MAG: hypothetical protein LBN24_11370 [Mediterranea sp.]|jgi:hypothetical protein|nr:hypothetical protein [Mediterranea sp.]